MQIREFYITSKRSAGPNGRSFYSNDTPLSFEVELDSNSGNYYDISDNLTIIDNTIELQEGDYF